ncbi:MAG: arginase family protein, partial [Candidatus Bathycorpusculaceae bacterium]
MKIKHSKLSKIGVLGIPYNTGSKGMGLDKGAEALRKAGIVDELKGIGSEVVDYGNLELKLPPTDSSNPRLLNAGQVETICKALADKIERIATSGYLPFIIGGEDSCLMGIIEGLRRSLGPQIGMVYMDAHGDFNTPETTPSGIIGGMDVAITVGRGARELVDMFGLSPLLQEENVVLYGVRDLDELEEIALTNSRVNVFMREKIRERGAEQTAKDVLTYLERKCEHLYVHVDLDVLDESVVSAQGLPVPDGLTKIEFQD